MIGPSTGSRSPPPDRGVSNRSGGGGPPLSGGDVRLFSQLTLPGITELATH